MDLATEKTLNVVGPFVGDYKYRLMTDYNDIDPCDDDGDYVINRERLYRDRRVRVRRLREGLHCQATTACRVS